MSPGFDPMGTIVDVIRYPYRTTMRFYKDSALETPVCWYFCSPEAKPLGCYTRFGSGLYGKDYMDRWEGVGETAFGPLDFRANCCALPGKARIGTPEQFAEGVSINDRLQALAGLVGDCTHPPLTLMGFGAVFLDVANFNVTPWDSELHWNVFGLGPDGYVPPNALLTMTCENDPSLNGSWVVSWISAPDAQVLYTSAGVDAISDCQGNTSFPTFQVWQSGSDGSFVNVVFSGTNITTCDSVLLTGSARPVNYSGSDNLVFFGNVTMTLTELPPFVPPPYPPI